MYFDTRNNFSFLSNYSYQATDFTLLPHLHNLCSNLSSSIPEKDDSYQNDLLKVSESKRSVLRRHVPLSSASSLLQNERKKFNKPDEKQKVIFKSRNHDLYKKNLHGKNTFAISRIFSKENLTQSLASSKIIKKTVNFFGKNFFLKNPENKTNDSFFSTHLNKSHDEVVSNNIKQKSWHNKSESIKHEKPKNEAIAEIFKKTKKGRESEKMRLIIKRKSREIEFSVSSDGNFAKRNLKKTKKTGVKNQNSDSDQAVYNKLKKKFDKEVFDRYYFNKNRQIFQTSTPAIPQNNNWNHNTENKEKHNTNTKIIDCNKIKVQNNKNKLLNKKNKFNQYKKEEETVASNYINQDDDDAYRYHSGACHNSEHSEPHPAFFYIDCTCNVWFTIEFLVRFVLSLAEFSR